MTRLALRRAVGALRGERGSAGISTFFAVMFLIGLLGVAVGGMRVMTGQGDISAAARAAARAAAIEHDQGVAEANGRLAAQQEVAQAGNACQPGTLNVSFAYPNGFEPGGLVTVTATCVTTFGDLFTLGWGADKTLTAVASEPIDCLRGGGSGPAGGVGPGAVTECRFGP